MGMKPIHLALKSDDVQRYAFLKGLENKLGVDLTHTPVEIQPGRDGAGSLSLFIGEKQGCNPVPAAIHISREGHAELYAGNGSKPDKDFFLPDAKEGLASMRSLITEKFGPYYLPRTVITAAQAGDLWPKLAPFDIVDEKGNYKRRDENNPKAPRYEVDKKITNDDLLASGDPAKTEAAIQKILAARKK